MSTYETLDIEEEKKASGLSYDPTTSESYNAALRALEAARSALPSYADSYSGKKQSLYEQITGRQFRYNVGDDALYQQYREQYTQQGRKAMMDSMGQAAALTGGYGSTYSQSVGQQQYGEYLQRLNEVVPELYSQAYQRWQDEGEAMLDEYDLINAEAQEEYQRYQDAVDAYWKEVDYQQGRVDEAYEQGLTADEMAYGRMQDNYAKLVDLMTTTGYEPTDQELEAAGMTQSQRSAYLTWYAQQNAGSSGSSGGSSRKKSSTSSSAKTVAEAAVVGAGVGALAGSAAVDTSDSTQVQRNADGTYSQVSGDAEESWWEKIVNGIFKK